MDVELCGEVVPDGAVVFLHNVLQILITQGKLESIYANYLAEIVERHISCVVGILTLKNVPESSFKVIFKNARLAFQV